MNLERPYSGGEFVAHEQEYYDAGEALLAERDVWPDGTMTQLSLYAEIAYLREFIDGLLRTALGEGT